MFSYSNLSSNFIITEFSIRNHNTWIYEKNVFVWRSRCMNVQFDEWLIVILCCLHLVIFFTFIVESCLFFRRRRRRLLRLMYTIEIAMVERSHILARWKFDICGQVLIQVKYWKEEDTMRKDIDKELSHRFLFLFIFDIDRYIYISIQLSMREWVWLLLNFLIIDRITFIKKKKKNERIHFENWQIELIWIYYKEKKKPKAKFWRKCVQANKWKRLLK
jgi:hypothetical protein